jgi:hypothetical protein
MSCQNPCGTVPVNSAQSETLPSQIENFTKQFFGTVVKTEVDGVVSWSLPCGLETGLPENPRGVGEALACYFLRLFEDGIVGLKGDTGATGASGSNGANAYTVTLASFTQPTLAAPTVQVVTQYNPAIREDMYIFIDTAGWFIVDGTDGNGTLFLRLVNELSTPASGTISAGKLVVPSGWPGASITGPAGPTGAQGPQGADGNTTTDDNGSYYESVGTDYTVPIAYAQVNFTASEAEVTLPVAGKYLVIATVHAFGLAGVAAADIFYAKLRNTTTNGDVTGAVVVANDMSQDMNRTLPIVAIVQTSAANETISLWARGSVDSKFKVEPDYTHITYVRLA